MNKAGFAARVKQKGYVCVCVCEREREREREKEICKRGVGSDQFCLYYLGQNTFLFNFLIGFKLLALKKISRRVET